MTRDQAVAERTKALMDDQAFWHETFEGHNPLSAAIEEQMARLMRNLDGACLQGGSLPVKHYAIQALLASLAIIQREAKHRARKQAEDEIPEAGDDDTDLVTSDWNARAADVRGAR